MGWRIEAEEVDGGNEVPTPTERNDQLEEFDDLTEGVLNSDSKMFQTHLERWFRFLDEQPDFAAEIKKKESDVDFPAWWTEQRRALKEPVPGLRKLDWPTDNDECLGIQISLFRQFSSGDINPVTFTIQFLKFASKPDELVSYLVDQIFKPLSKDLRRLLKGTQSGVIPLSVVTNGLLRPQDEIPASDRVVPLDHNSDAYSELMGALDDLTEAFKGFNKFGNEEEGKQLQAEVSAGRRLLKAPQVRLGAASAVLGGVLMYILEKFGDTVLGNAAQNALQKLLEFLPALQGIIG